MSKVHIHKCINELQETKAAPGCYKDILVVNKTYKVEMAVRIIKESRSYSCYNTEDLRGKSGTVVMCCCEENHWSHYVAVYVLLDNCKAYGSLVVVNGTPQSICKCGEEEQHTNSKLDGTCGNFLVKYSGS